MSSACGAHREDGDSREADEQDNALEPIGQQRLALMTATELHTASTVTLAHEHRIASSEFSAALAGGVTALGLDIQAGDGQYFVSRCRVTRQPSQMYQFQDP